MNPKCLLKIDSQKQTDSIDLVKKELNEGLKEIRELKNKWAVVNEIFADKLEMNDLLSGEIKNNFEKELDEIDKLVL